jgi:hypothetical protein
MSSNSRILGDFYKAVREDIFKLCLAFNFTPTWQQAMVLQAVMDAKYGRGSNWIAVKSGQGPGKTTVSVLIAVWRCLQDVDTMTVVTAPTMRQCREVWLAEARRLLEKADPILKNLIKVTATKLTIAGRPEWCVRTVTATREENAQGYHDPNMTVIVEEASGVPREIVTQFKGTLSNPNSLLIQIGNPNTRDCDFFDCFNNDRGRWKTMTFNAEDTARDYPHIVNPQRNKDLEEEFGRDSDVYRVRVLGEFPLADVKCLFSLEDLQKCSNPAVKIAAAKLSGARVFGLDFARFGGDENVVMRRQGNAIVEWWKQSRVDPSTAVDRAFSMQFGAGWANDSCLFVADAGGIGQGVMNQLYVADRRVKEFHNGGVALESDKYADAITEGWFNLAKLVKKGEAYLPNDRELHMQLSTRQYTTNKKGRLVLESKDIYMRRGHESPDRADGSVYAFFDPEKHKVSVSRVESADPRKQVIR